MSKGLHLSPEMSVMVKNGNSVVSELGLDQRGAMFEGLKPRTDHLKITDCFFAVICFSA